jgi:predicted HTH domain antitoxin
MSQTSSEARTFEVNLPNEAFQLRRLEPQEVAQEMRLLWLLEEVRSRRLDFGKAADLAGISRAEFLGLMGKRDAYIAERVYQYQNWYDKKAVHYKSLYLRMRAFAVVGGGLVPVLINVGSEWTIRDFPVVRPLVTLISLLVVIFVSLESVYHFREQWKNYRSTEQLLGHELFRFRTGVAPYQGESDEAFLRFVERIEDAIAAENAATLNIMTTAAEPLAEKLRHGKDDAKKIT